MHGYNQGLSVLLDMISSYTPDLLFLQEHWLTPHNMIKFNNDFPDFHVFSCSTMESCVELGPLAGRLGALQFWLRKIYYLLVSVLMFWNVWLL